VKILTKTLSESQKPQFRVRGEKKGAIKKDLTVVTIKLKTRPLFIY